MGKRKPEDIVIVNIPFPEYSDITFVSSDGVTFPVHRVYLAKYEPIKTLFESSEERVINFDYTAHELSYILNEIYDLKLAIGLNTVEAGNVIIFKHVYMFLDDEELVVHFVYLIDQEVFDSDEVYKIADQLLAMNKFVNNNYLNIEIIPKKLCCVMKKEEIELISNYTRNYFHHKEIRSILPRPSIKEVEQFNSIKDEDLIDVYGAGYMNYKNIGDSSRIYTDSKGSKFVVNCIINGVLSYDGKTIYLDKKIDRDRIREDWDKIRIISPDLKYIMKRKLENAINNSGDKTDLIIDPPIVYNSKTTNVLYIYKIVCRIPEPYIIPNPYGVDESGDCNGSVE